MSQGYGYRSEQRLRKENQDTMGVFEFNGFTLLVVCDGMGGHVGGAQASALAVRTMHDELSSSTAADIPSHLERAVEAANRAIYEEARRNYKLMGMGTTVVAAAIVGDVAHIAHVGDSRCYMVRNGTAESLTRDHTMVNLFVDAELLSPEDAATHPEAHVLSRSLGVERQVDVDISDPITLHDTDRLLLCSDGVHGVVGQSALASIDWGNPQRGCDVALEAVAIAEGDDNATLAVFGLDISGSSSPPTDAPDPEAIADAVRATSGGLDVQPISGSNAPAGIDYDDVAPIEEMETAAAPELPAPVVAKVDPRRARVESNIKAVVALLCLGVIGGSMFTHFRNTGEPVAANNGTQQPVAAKDEPVAAPDRKTPTIPAATTEPDPPEPVATEPEPVEPTTDPVADDPVQDPVVDNGSDAVDPTDAVAMVDPDPVEDPVEPEVIGEVGEAASTPPTLNSMAALCVNCSWSYGLPPVDIYLDHAGGGLAGVFYAPEVPALPKRLPHSAMTFTNPAPRGPEQAAAVRAARDKDCRGTTDIVASAIGRSPDFATLYRTAWLCFNDAYQSKLRDESASPEAFYAELSNFQGDWEPPTLAPGQQPTAVALRYDAPALGGIEYRLQLFERDSRDAGFQAVILDLLGEGVVTDQLGLDLILEATAAAAFSRLDDPDRQAAEVWARRVYVATSAMEGPIGDLVRSERSDIATIVDTLIFEATGGDEGQAALQGEPLPPGVPAIVMEAYAKALGRDVPDVAPPPAPVSQPIAVASSPKTPSRGTTKRPRPRPRPATVATTEPAAQVDPDKPLMIKVYKRKPEVEIRGPND